MTSFIRTISRRKVPLGIVALAAVAAVPLLVALNPLAGSGATATTGSSAASVGANAEQLRAALAILRRPTTASDALPATAQDALATLHAGADASQARRALVTVSGVAVYLVPSEKGVCLVDSNLSQSGCFPTSAVLGSGATQSNDCSSVLPSGNTIEIAGIVPDGAINPTLIMSDGSRQVLEVKENAYLEQFDRHGPLPSQIEWQSATGPVTVSADVPSDVATEQCATRSELKALEAAGKIPPASGHPPAQPTIHVEHNKG